jgi:hypothetical protein
MSKQPPVREVASGRRSARALRAARIVKALVRSAARSRRRRPQHAGTNLLDLKRTFRGYAALLLTGDAAVSPEHLLIAQSETRRLHFRIVPRMRQHAAAFASTA